MKMLQTGTFLLFCTSGALAAHAEHLCDPAGFFFWLLVKMPCAFSGGKSRTAWRLGSATGTRHCALRRWR